MRAVDVEYEVPSFAELVEFLWGHACDYMCGVVPEFFAAVKACRAFFDEFEDVLFVFDNVGTFAEVSCGILDGNFFIFCCVNEL